MPQARQLANVRHNGFERGGILLFLNALCGPVACVKRELALRDSAPTSKNTPPPAVVRPLNLPIEVPLPIASSGTMET